MLEYSEYLIPDSDPDIQDDDYVINASRSGYAVDLLNECYQDYDECIKAIANDMIKNNFYPDVWYINDHGNIDLLAISVNSLETTVIQSWV